MPRPPFFKISLKNTLHILTLMYLLYLRAIVMG
ncbi:hypothetical protein SAMN05518684_1391, partial [Salipaludibacillus aurantiacus]